MTYGFEFYPCVVCGNPSIDVKHKSDTSPPAQSTCTRCWELGFRIEGDPLLAQAFIIAIAAGHDYRTVRYKGPRKPPPGYIPT